MIKMIETIPMIEMIKMIKIIEIMQTISFMSYVVSLAVKRKENPDYIISDPLIEKLVVAFIETDFGPGLTTIILSKYCFLAKKLHTVNSPLTYPFY